MNGLITYGRGHALNAQYGFGGAERIDDTTAHDASNSCPNDVYIAVMAVGGDVTLDPNGCEIAGESGVIKTGDKIPDGDVWQLPFTKIQRTSDTVGEIIAIRG